MASATTPPITIYSSSGSANTLPSSIPFTILDLGTGTANTVVQQTAVTPTSAPAKLPSPSEISNIAFGPQGGTPSGVFAGAIGGQSANPFGSNNILFGGKYTSTIDYLVAGASGTVTVSYTKTQDALQILWGSVDGAPTNNNNIITFMNGLTMVGTVNGADIATAASSLTGAPPFVSGTTNIALRISGLPGFNSVVLSDPGAAAFEFALGTPVPEPATFGLFGVAAAGVAFVSLRGRARRARPAA